MPQELLRSVVPAARSPRRWLMLPVSIGAHGAVVVVSFVMPLATVDNLPVPAPPSSIIRYVKVVPPPSPPVERPQRAPGPANPKPYAAPTAAPSRIDAEVPTPPSGPPGESVPGALPGSPGVEGGLPEGGVLVPPPPPPPEPPTQPVRVGLGVREPKKIVDVAPVYPRIAQTARVEGVVILEAVIDTTGRIDRLRVIRSAPLLDEAAIAAVKQWRYTPTLLNNVPVPVLMTITVVFRLQ